MTTNDIPLFMTEAMSSSGSVGEGHWSVTETCVGPYDVTGIVCGWLMT